MMEYLDTVRTKCKHYMLKDASSIIWAASGENVPDQGPGSEYKETPTRFRLKQFVCVPSVGYIVVNVLGVSKIFENGSYRIYVIFVNTQNIRTSFTLTVFIVYMWTIPCYYMNLNMRKRTLWTKAYAPDERLKSDCASAQSD